MPRPYVPTFEDEPEEGTKSAPKPVAPRPSRVAPPTRPPLVRQKHKGSKPHASATWYAVQAFADTLLTERERRKWHQTEMASHCGMGTSQYRKIEGGASSPTIWLANRICRRLGIVFSLGEYPE